MTKSWLDATYMVVAFFSALVVTVLQISSFVFTGERGGSEVTKKSKQSKSEKKSHKAMLKLGMKPVIGVSRVTIKRTNNVCGPNSVEF